MMCHRQLIKLIGLALFDTDGVHRAFAQTGPQSVAQVLGRQHRLAVDDGDGPFGAGGYSLAAAVAFIRIDFYNFS